MDAASKLEDGAFVATNPNMNLGEEHVGMKRSVYERSVYDLTILLPETSMTEERRTKFFKAFVDIMPEGTMDDMWKYAKRKPAGRKAWNAAKSAKTAQH
eukprot:7357535-Karenia_brevis.AAC.1